MADATSRLGVAAAFLATIGVGFSAVCFPVLHLSQAPDTNVPGHQMYERHLLSMSADIWGVKVTLIFIWIHTAYTLQTLFYERFSSMVESGMATQGDS